MYIIKIFLVLTLLVISSHAIQGNKRVKRIVGGEPAALPPEDDPKVFVRFAGRFASITGALDFPHYVFKGIRFGEKPTGRDRFLRPKQHFLKGDVDATKYPPPCVQPVPGTDKIIGDEDCLFLNVFTPTLPEGTEGLPVIVWIHGGGFRYGSASQYGVRHLVGKRLVLVTIQYRLGSLGFLSSGSPDMPGNAALWDMALAVQWVRNYIGFFGGNPHQIVVMGHGTGASSALFVALSSIAKGLASAVVAMSGSSVSHWAIDNTPAITGKEVADFQGCPTMSVLPMVRCLQHVSAVALIKADSQMEMARLQRNGFVSGLNGVLSPAPVAEGKFDGRSLPPVVENKPLDEMMFGNIPKIPLLTGITKDETKKACHGQYKNEIQTKLTTIPRFLDNILIKNLQVFTGLESTDGSSNFNILDPLQFTNYLKITKNNLQEGVGKIAEITADALFNLPAFLTADLWSKQGAPTYLYRFEHSGNARKGHHFLKGTTLVGNQTTADIKDTVGHGDDLGYLFEARNIDGSPLKEPEVLTEEDQKVREIYTQMIADFARHKTIGIGNHQVPTFTASSNNFVQISAKPKLSNNFRFCEMALWAGLAQRLQSSTCSLFKVLDSQLQGAGTLLFDTVDSTSSQISNLGQIAGPVNQLNPFKMFSATDNNQRAENKPKVKPVVPLLGFL